MTERHHDRKWQSFLPPAYFWLESLKTDTSSSLPASGWMIVPCIVKDQNCDWGGLDAGIVDQITAEADKQGWKKSTNFVCKIQDTYVQVVVASGIPVGPHQIGRQLGLDAAAALGERQIGELVFSKHQEFDPLDVFEGYVAGNYTATLFKGKAEERTLPEKVSFWGKAPSSDQVKQAVASSRAGLFMRMLQDAPANWLTPVRWAEIAEDLLGKKSSLQISGPEQLKELNMGSFLSVAAGATTEPRMISAKFKGKNSSKTIALVGKGLTFDAGGISLKPSAGMGEMKYDMSGGAAVMAAAHYYSEIDPEINVHCLIGCVENMPSGSATKPGDVVQARNGKTIEILNTDAEGRLVLADLLTYAGEDSLKPDLVVDLATLTGAVIVGLGHVGAGLMSPDDQARQFIQNCANKVGEPIWPLPLWPELAAETKSDVADLKNIASPKALAGSIMGGMFLNNFVPDGIRWAHIDVAGTAWSSQAVGYPKSGGSGYGLGLLREVIRSFEL